MSRKTGVFTLLLLTLLMIAGCSGSSTSSQTPQTPLADYIENKGSDTMVNMALAWAENYQVSHPDTRLSVTGGGSGTGITALINGTVDIANASRQIKQEEIDLAVKNGVIPIEFIVARDAIGIIVNWDNPVDQLTLQQLSDMYSGVITNWNEVGGEDMPIVLLSRETNSGTHVYFLEEVLRLGEKDNETLFSPTTLLLPSSQGITTEVRQNVNAIGYDGLGYITDEEKVLAIARTKDDPYVLPSVETVNDKSYPIARDLYMYTNGEPAGQIKEYLDWVFSTEAQEIVRELGFVPILP